MVKKPRNSVDGQDRRRSRNAGRLIGPSGGLNGRRHGYRRTFYKNQNLGEIGWKVMISREPEDFDDNWQRVG